MMLPHIDHCAWQLAAIALAAILAGAPSPVDAAPTAVNRLNTHTAEAPRSTARFVYKADGKRLSEVLNDFAASQGLPVVVDSRVEGVVSGNFDTTPREFLDGISRAYALLWYFDGTAFYFYPASAIQSRIFRLKGYRREQVVQLLDSLRLSSARYPIRFDSANSTLLVYGPPRHVELVGLAIESLDIGAIEGNRRIARVFPLRFASAGDRQLGSVTVPGVAATLQTVYGGSSGSGAQNPTAGMVNASNEASRGMAPMNKVMQSMYGADSRSKFMPDFQSKGGGGAADDRTGAAPAPRNVRSPLEDDMQEDNAIFSVDEGTNSVIVYAKARRMDEFATMIRTLDVQPVLVELEATIIDVSADSLSELGVDWSLTGSKGQISMSGGGGTPQVNVGSGLSTTPFTVSTLVQDAGRALLAHVAALEGSGRARVVSKPRVLGMANRPATMTDKRIANVRVAGNLDANLFQVEAGTTLQVTPQVGGSNGSAQIKLSIYIQDGSFETTVVDQVPVVKKTEIRTEARVAEGESLLIGGISIESDTAGASGIPFLKDIPLIGAAFRQTSRHTARVERMFLLTPRIVAAPAPPSARTSAQLNMQTGKTVQPASQPVVQAPRESSAPSLAMPIIVPAMPVRPIPVARTAGDDDLQALLGRLASVDGLNSDSRWNRPQSGVRKP